MWRCPVRSDPPAGRLDPPVTPRSNYEQEGEGRPPLGGTRERVSRRSGMARGRGSVVARDGVREPEGRPPLEDSAVDEAGSAIRRRGSCREVPMVPNWSFLTPASPFSHFVTNTVPNWSFFGRSSARMYTSLQISPLARLPLEEPRAVRSKGPPRPPAQPPAARWDRPAPPARATPPGPGPRPPRSRTRPARDNPPGPPRMAQAPLPTPLRSSPAPSSPRSPGGRCGRSRSRRSPRRRPSLP
jgi:hypothetical protein